MTEISQDARIQALEERLNAAEARLREVEDTEEIHRLQRTYGYYLDDGQWDEIIDLLTEDCSVEINGRGVYLGKKGAEVFFKKCLKGGPETGYLGNHLMMQGVVHVDPSGSTAKGRYQVFIQLGVFGDTALWMGGLYENEYAKEDGKWKFRKLHWYTKFSVPYEDGWAKSALPLIPPSEEYPPDLPPSVDYETFPGHFFVPYHFKNPVTGK